jgi:hypothetical protein
MTYLEGYGEESLEGIRYDLLLRIVELVSKHIWHQIEQPVRYQYSCDRYIVQDDHLQAIDCSKERQHNSQRRLAREKLVGKAS